ncbi:hypothetical protein BpHYR1_048102 [Brachionus plicatilis]|uniref:Uncharacterized protein n=1 Tax=Brachionus plicatilis TaxID=10195 RepID=A0A3M7R6Q8_BRAPC|nr:hypothetical protein BpHYR1_048102 [Brachionus plicatilis]
MSMEIMWPLMFCCSLSKDTSTSALSAAFSLAMKPFRKPLSLGFLLRSRLASIDESSVRLRRCFTLDSLVHDFVLNKYLNKFLHLLPWTGADFLSLSKLGGRLSSSLGDFILLTIGSLWVLVAEWFTLLNSVELWLLSDGELDRLLLWRVSVLRRESMEMVEDFFWDILLNRFLNENRRDSLMVSVLSEFSRDLLTSRK